MCSSARGISREAIGPFTIITSVIISVVARWFDFADIEPEMGLFQRVMSQKGKSQM